MKHLCFFFLISHTSRVVSQNIVIGTRSPRICKPKIYCLKIKILYMEGRRIRITRNSFSTFIRIVPTIETKKKKY